MWERERLWEGRQVRIACRTINAAHGGIYIWYIYIGSLWTAYVPFSAAHVWFLIACVWFVAAYM